MASGVYQIFDSSSNNLINGVILLQKIPYYNLNCLDMAAKANCQQFIAIQSVQSILSGKNLSIFVFIFYLLILHLNLNWQIYGWGKLVSNITF